LQECKKILWNPSNTKVQQKKVAGDTKTKQINTQQGRAPIEETQHSQNSMGDHHVTFMDTLCLVKALLLRSWYMQWMGRNPVMLALRLLVTATLTACAVTTCHNTNIHLISVSTFTCKIISRCLQHNDKKCFVSAAFDRWQARNSQNYLLEQDIYNSACNMTSC